MKVDTMRKIDYWLGIPITFVLSALLKTKQVFIKTKKTQAKNILLIELSEMGSTIICDPMMQKLKKTYNANLHFVIFKQNKLSLNLLNTVKEENIFTLRENNILSLVMDFLKYIIWCRKKNIDTVIDLELFSRVTAIMTGVSGANNKIGFYSFHNEGLYRGDMLNYKVSYNPHIHMAKNFIALANSLSTADELPYSKTYIADSEIKLQTIDYRDDEKRRVFNLIKDKYSNIENKRIVLINPNASDLLPQRRWQKSSFKKVINKILNNYEDVIILITGSPSEFDEIEKLKDKVDNKRCINFAGAVELLDLPILYSISILMLTNDSGPGHFSAITKMPTFVLFGPETPKLYGSLGNSTAIYAGLACSPCVSANNHRKTPCVDNVCLKFIKANDVFKKLTTVLGKIN